MVLLDVAWVRGPSLHQLTVTAIIDTLASTFHEKKSERNFIFSLHIFVCFTCCFLMVTSSPPTGDSPRSSASWLVTHSLRSRRLTSNEFQSSPVFSSRDLQNFQFRIYISVEEVGVLTVVKGVFHPTNKSKINTKENIIIFNGWTDMHRRLLVIHNYFWEGLTHSHR